MAHQKAATTDIRPQTRNYATDGDDVRLAHKFLVLVMYFLLLC